MLDTSLIKKSTHQVILGIDTFLLANVTFFGWSITQLLESHIYLNETNNKRKTTANKRVYNHTQ
jgi:hypothetical protein